MHGLSSVPRAEPDNLRTLTAVIYTSAPARLVGDLKSFELITIAGMSRHATARSPMALPTIGLIAPLASQRRMEILPAASAGSLHHFLTNYVEPGASVITDVWMGHFGITGGLLWPCPAQ